MLTGAEGSRGENMCVIVSTNRGTPTQTPKCYNPEYLEPENGAPNFGKHPYIYICIYIWSPPPRSILKGLAIHLLTNKYIITSARTAENTVNNSVLLLIL